MALARDEDDVSLTRNANGLGDGFAPPGDLACSGRSRHDRGPYECGILAPGIVVRDDNDVGQHRRNAPHLRALALVAVAARAEHGDQATVDMWAERRNRRFECIGGVSIVDIDRDSAATDHGTFQPAAHRRHPLHGRKGVLPLAARREHQSGRGQHVGRLVSADQRQCERLRLPAVLQKQLLAERGRALIDEANGLALAADRHHPMAMARRALDDLLGLGIVGPDDCRFSGLKQLVEQPHLGLEIGGHRLVII